MNKWEYEYKPYKLEDMAKRLDVDIDDLKALHKQTPAFFDVVFKGESRADTCVGVSLDGLRTVVKHQKGDADKIKSLKRRVAQAIVAYDCSNK